MTENDEYIIQLRNNDIEQLFYNNDITNNNCALMFEYIRESGLYSNIEYNFEDIKIRAMLEDFNKSEYMAYSDFEKAYVIVNLIPSYTTFLLDYVVSTGTELLPLFDEKTACDNSFEGFNELPENIKSIFLILTTVYEKILSVFALNNSGPSSKIIKTGDYSISLISKAYYLYYYQVYYSKGYLSNGNLIKNNIEENNDDDENIPEVEIKKETKDKTKKRKNTNTKPPIEDSAKQSIYKSVDDYIKNISSIMSNYWMEDDYTWKEMDIDLYGLPDIEKTSIFDKLQKKFDVDFSYDVKKSTYIFKIKIRD